MAGVGVIPSTELLESSGLSMTKQGFVNVDRYLRAINISNNQPFSNVYAGGDIAMFPQMLVVYYSFEVIIFTPYNLIWI